MLQKWINIPSTSAFRAFSSKKANTQRYIMRQTKDEFAVKAREHNYRARSAFKLLEIDDKFKFLKNDSVVLDVGCAPGSWTQVLTEKCSSGYVIGVDLQNVMPVKGADILSNCDITSLETQKLIRQNLEGKSVDAVLSDMAPNPTGDNATDHLRLIELCRTVFHLFSRENAFQISQNFVFLCKIWDGSARGEFVKELSQRFSIVKTVKPTACRDNSAELYLFCKKFK